MKYWMILLLAIILPLSMFSQSMLKLSGKVVDAETKELLGYASVSLKGKPIGTITNTDGSFDFYISSANEKDTLVISMLGYHGFQAIIKNLITTTPLLIGLKIKPVLLDEMTVIAGKLTGQEIIVKAFDKIEDNFPTTPYLMKTFFREMYEENNKTVFVIDAVAAISDDGYKAIKGNKNLLKEKVHAENVRVSAKYFNSIFRPDNFSYLTYCFTWRTIKYRDPDQNSVFKGKQYELDSLIYSDEDLLYKVSYTTDTKEYRSKDTYYVDSKTYAIKKHVIEDQAKPGRILNKWRFAKDTTYWYRNKKRYVTQEYEMHNGKMFLKYITGEFEAEIYHTTTQSVEHTLNTNELLLVTDIETENFNKISRKENVSPWKCLTEYAGIYNPAFWNNYDEAKLFPLTKKQVKDLEWQMPLEEQFKRNGKLNNVKSK